VSCVEHSGVVDVILCPLRTEVLLNNVPHPKEYNAVVVQSRHAMAKLSVSRHQAALGILQEMTRFVRVAENRWRKMLCDK